MLVTHKWVATTYFTNPEIRLTWHQPKPATNPPTVISYWEEVIDVPYFSDDGWYPVPAKYVPEGFASGMQHRRLIAIGEGFI